MTAVASESVAKEFNDEFDLDIRIDDIDPAEPDRIHRALTFGTSCTMCCGVGGTGCSVTAYCTDQPCGGPTMATCNTDCLCTGRACN